ncbi:type IV pilus modification PilV family protein [Stigmatella erecta]|uniref:Type IV pilus assembly protein PilV n=1 Tax=Stigmatella erecta TaxID=83460 RepID=A0A1I0KJ02_9BACT|nr:hypothetical protein [Stigmatella erecta]SEU24894.1 type IV pilus assembly protein PilV [Stigmatella erecta]
MLSQRPSPRGTTIIEAMAAMLVFTVGILGVMQMNVLASGQNTLAMNQTTANRIARDLADAFERLPYNHPAFAPSGLTMDDLANDSIGDGVGFDDITNSTGLVTLNSVLAPAGQRPLFGAADAIQMAEGLNPADPEPFFRIAWRSLQVPNTGSVESERGKMDSLRILIMVRFPTQNGGFRQVNFWTIKYNPELVCAGTCTALEI